ncbi:MAG: hypothetical protein DMG13_07205 [Acidobacteria bacterium]|nr:MAG: hypothetical protein DMG13_07205 [Acidobacteriota bacterium]
MIITPERFWQGYSWEQYLGRIRRNRELFQKSYDAVELTGEEVDWIQRSGCVRCYCHGRNRPNGVETLRTEL